MLPPNSAGQLAARFRVCGATPMQQETDAEEKLNFEGRMKRLKCCGCFSPIDRIDHIFFVVACFNIGLSAGVSAPKPGPNVPPALFALHHQIQDVNDERSPVPPPSIIEVPLSGCLLDQRKRISRSAAHCQKQSRRVGLPKYARLHAGHRRATPNR